MKAFIGHSFAEQDENLINSIKSFLALRSVQFETGEKAQNKSIAGKVKERIDRNGVFIGIFTIEKLLDGKNVVSWFKRSKQYEFTTSNWVLQESGYAIGKGKELIFLVEKGIARFPELQGDAELIYFTRDKAGLNEALLKLLDMVQGMSSAGPMAKQEPLLSQDQGSVDKLEEKTKAKQQTENKAIPWEEVFEAHDKGEIDKAKEIYDKSIKIKLTPEEVLLWDAVFLRWEYCSGKSAALHALDKLAAENESYAVYWQIGICHESTDKYDLAITTLIKCLELAKDTQQKVDALIRIAQCYSLSDRYEIGIDKLLEKLNDPEYKEFQESLYSGLAKIAKRKKDDELLVLFLEKVLDVNPVNTNARFDLAYKYGEMDKNDLAIYHYKKLLEVEDNDTAFNNIGVKYSDVSLKGRCVSCYQKSIDKKNPLALSNIAYKYIDAGFFDLAEKAIKNADELSAEGKDIPSNVGYAKNRLKEIREEEEKKEQEILSSARQKLIFKIRLSNAYCRLPADDSYLSLLSRKLLLKEKWGVQLNVDKAKKTFGIQAEKEFDDTFGLELSALLGVTRGFGNAPVKICKIRKLNITGTFKNFSGQYVITITEEKKDASLLDKRDEVYSAKGSLIFDSATNKIAVMEEDGKGNCHFEEWKAV